MKKILTVLLAIIITVSLCACGKQETNEDFGGTWKVEYVEYDGSKFTVEEWNNMEDEDLSNFYIIFKDGGKAYIYDGDYGDLVNWLKSDDSIMIGDEKCSIVDDKICFDYYGDKIFLTKTSENQEIPEDSDTDNIDEDEISSEDEIIDDEDSSDNTEWKQFISDYEAWIDNYIEIVKKYKANPSDMSILSDYTEMLSEMTEWTERADDIKLELEDTSEALEFSAELIRISGKLAKAAY